MEDDELDEEEDGYPMKADLLNLVDNGGIWYGPFHCYPPEEQDLQ
ncbi:MAG: hypothetical protein ABW155_15375 [Candidatus Thiodiazotropha sp.]